MDLINWFTAAKLGHKFLAEVIKPGDVVVDGTMGNGHDTVILAELVGPRGKVIAFDIQAQAIASTKERLQSAGLLDQRVELLEVGHEDIKNYVNESLRGAIYNLGYLPGGNHSIITNTETTLRAITDTIQLLYPGGRLVIVVYPGHPGGDKEKTAVVELLSSLNSQEYRVINLNFLNRPPTAPGVILLEKVAGRG